MTKTFTYEIDDDYNFDEIKYTVYHDELLEAVSFFIYEEYFLFYFHAPWYTPWRWCTGAANFGR